MSLEFKRGQTFRLIIPFSQPNECKIHICHVVDSCYDGGKLVIFRTYGKHKQWWHEFMLDDYALESYIIAHDKRSHQQPSGEWVMKCDQ